MSLMAPPAPSVGQLGSLGVSDGGVLAVHPAWWAATRAFDGVGWMQLFGTACSHLCDGSVSRRRQCGWRGPLIRVDGCMRVCARLLGGLRPVATQVFKGGGVLSRDVPLAADGAAGAQERQQRQCVRVQWQRGRPRRPLLAAFIWKASCAALAHAAGVQGRRCARVQHAAMWLMVSKQWYSSVASAVARAASAQPLLAAIE
jgi:hypothetical protein